MTSIEWLLSKISSKIDDEYWSNQQNITEYVEIAKEMHKQQIIDAVNLPKEKRWYDAKLYNSSGEQYYKDTFVSKGSDEVELPKLNIILSQLPKQDVDKLGNEDVPKLGYDDDLPTTTSDLIDSVIWSLPFEERMKCWDLIEKLVEEEKETLYTEEQVREALSTSRFLFIKEEAELIIQSLKQPKD